MSRPALLAIAFVSVALLAWGLWPRHPMSEEDRVREVILDSAKAASDHDLSRLLSHVSESYEGEFGHRDDLRSALAAYFFTSRDLVVSTANVSVSVSGSHATGDLTALFARTGAPAGEGPFGSRRIHVELEKPSGAWLVVGATSREATAADLVR